MSLINQHEQKDTLVHSAAGAGTYTTDDINASKGRGVIVVIDITAVGGTPTDTVTIEGKDRVSGKYFPLLVSTALATTGTTALRIYPGITATANVSASDIIPDTIRVKSVIAGTTPSITATISTTIVA